MTEVEESADEAPIEAAATDSDDDMFGSSAPKEQPVVEKSDPVPEPAEEA